MPMLLAVPQSVLVLLPRTNIRGPMLLGRPTDCLNHIVTAKFVTLPKPRVELVAAARFPVTPWLKLEVRSMARLPVVRPATPEFVAPWRLVVPPVVLSIC